MKSMFRPAAHWITFAFLCIGIIPQVCFAQLSVNTNWIERTGLTVASSQVVAAKVEKVRFFASLESTAADPLIALRNLRVDKQAVLTSLESKGLKKSDVFFSTSRILEWEDWQESNLYAATKTRRLTFGKDSENCTALTHVTFDFRLTNATGDELLLEAYEIAQRLRRDAIFENRELTILFVGEVEASQIKDAHQRAYREAFDEAEYLAALAGRSLGRLAALTPEVDGRWRYWSGTSYAVLSGDSSLRNPLAAFRPKENEVFGTDPSNLTRTYTIDMRFEIK